MGNKLRPKSSFQGPMFVYNYGFSFHFAVSALILCEVAGTLSIFLYIRSHQMDWKEEMERQAFVDMPPGVSGVGGHYRPSLTVQPPDLPPLPAQIFCKKHGRGRRYSRTRDISREPSPVPMGMGGVYYEKSPRSSLSVPLDQRARGIPLSESMRDLSYFNFPTQANSMPFSRETTCNTVSTSVDINRDISRDHSRDLSRDISRDMSRDLSRELSTSGTLRDYSSRSESLYRSDFPPLPLPPPQIPMTREEAEYMCNFEGGSSGGPLPPRRDFSYETLRRTTPV